MVDIPEKTATKKIATVNTQTSLIDSYQFEINSIPISIKIYRARSEFVPVYEVSISTISENTEIILEKIREELITQVHLGIIELADTKKTTEIEDEFKRAIHELINKHFPDANKETLEFLTAYLIQKSLGLGSIEILMGDKQLEEIAINSADQPVWVYHRKHGWLKTNIKIESEEQIKHYSSMIGRKVGRQINILDPLMDANLSTGDRVNATLMPISLNGNTITFRKFASKPWTITDFIEGDVLSAEAAALIWLAVQYEFSTLIAGGTATGKTSMLNVVSNFFPPNQRIISIEDTHEIQLPSFLHWVPMITRLPNTEGRGGVTMLDLLVNSLRMRPDRIVVGEIRRKEEAEVLFEAIHTGHSVYATVHANSAHETITRLTNSPISIPLSMLPAISMIIVQYRNRRTGIRRTFQIAEILPSSELNILMQLDFQKDKLLKLNNSKSLTDTLQLYTGMTKNEMLRDLNQKEKILQWLIKQKINTVETVGRVMAEYYTNFPNLMTAVNKNKPLDDHD